MKERDDKEESKNKLNARGANQILDAAPLCLTPKDHQHHNDGAREAGPPPVRSILLYFEQTTGVVLYALLGSK
jgi:hypothetical protein